MKELVERWSRPIFSLESKHAHGITEDRVRQNAQEVEEEVRGRRPTGSQHFV
jgi:hypothetical protein